MTGHAIEASRLQDLLGRIAERWPGPCIRLGNMETSWFRDKISETPVDRPVYVTSLARAGTTILLEVLSSHADFVTHQYRDFPFVHFPLWWNWVLDRAADAASEAVERAHGDGIFVTPESPEALEEVLWMAFFPHLHDPVRSNVLGIGEKAPEFEAFYVDHIRKLQYLRGGRRYLAKGNYNLSRIGFISRIFPTASFVVPVRDPASHILSLMNQHQRFCGWEREDVRILNYMRRAGHFEFGLDRRPIHFGDDVTVREILARWDAGEELRGWALYWASAYSHLADLLENHPDIARRTAIVDFDAFCVDPETGLSRLFEHCGMKTDAHAINREAKRIKPTSSAKIGLTAAERDMVSELTDGIYGRIRGFAGSA